MPSTPTRHPATVESVLECKRTSSSCRVCVLQLSNELQPPRGRRAEGEFLLQGSNTTATTQNIRLSRQCGQLWKLRLQVSITGPVAMIDHGNPIYFKLGLSANCTKVLLNCNEVRYFSPCHSHYITVTNSLKPRPSHCHHTVQLVPWYHMVHHSHYITLTTSPCHSHYVIVTTSSCDSHQVTATITSLLHHHVMSPCHCHHVTVYIEL